MCARSEGPLRLAVRHFYHHHLPHTLSVTFILPDRFCHYLNIYSDFRILSAEDFHVIYQLRIDWERNLFWSNAPCIRQEKFTPSHFLHFSFLSCFRSTNRSVLVSDEGWQRESVRADHRGGPSACLHRWNWCVLLGGFNGIQCLDLLQTQEEERTRTLHNLLRLHARMWVSDPWVLSIPVSVCT